MTNRFDSKSLYDVYSVTIQVRDRICGGMPRNKDLIRSWVEATTGHSDEQSEKLTQEAMDLLVNDVAEKSWIGFPEDQHGLFLQDRQLKACLKQSASLLGITKQKRGSKQVLAEGMEVKAVDGGQRIRMLVKGPDGAMAPVTKATGTHENAIHVTTAQGPRSALRRMDYVSRPLVSFQVWVLRTAPQEARHVGEDDLVEILKHAQENGLGASRSQSEGKFDVVEFQKVS